MTIADPKQVQDDEALRLLAHVHGRWFMRTQVGSVMEGVFVQIRDILSHATSQQEAYERLSQCAEAISDQESLPWKAYHRARTCVEQLMQADGRVDALLVGQTDGSHHLCLVYSQDERNMQRVRFFQMHQCRPLLRLEVESIRRSSFTTCQLCLQTISPQSFVVMTFGGTARHGKTCNCNHCNRAGTAYLFNIYECEKGTQRLVVPFLQQVAAPSKQQSMKRALERCWEQGWYILNKENILPS